MMMMIDTTGIQPLDREEERRTAETTRHMDVSSILCCLFACIHTSSLLLICRDALAVHTMWLMRIRSCVCVCVCVCVYASIQKKNKMLKQVLSSYSLVALLQLSLTVDA